MKVESALSGQVLDAEGALARLDGDSELFAEMVSFCLEDAPVLYNELRSAAEADDARAVRMKAHALKGLSASCGGVRAANAAQKVEAAGETGDLERVSSLVTTLGEELELLKQALIRYCS